MWLDTTLRKSWSLNFKFGSADNSEIIFKNFAVFRDVLVNRISVVLDDDVLYGI